MNLPKDRPEEEPSYQEGERKKLKEMVNHIHKARLLSANLAHDCSWWRAARLEGVAFRLMEIDEEACAIAETDVHGNRWKGLLKD